MTREQDKHYKVRTTYIDYYITKEDIDLPDPFESYGRMDIEEYSEEEIEDMIEETRSGLPQELELEITCEPEDLEDMIVDAISEEVGWLVNYFEYVIIEE
jgi:hypothetical protein